MIKIYKILEIDNTSKYYPKRLNILKTPPKIFVIGNEKILNSDSVAIIGSRNYSEYGIKMANKFSKDLTKKGICVVSGLAKGIDSVAHYSCIENGGKTIAVLGSGFNYIYPEENIKLYNLILETGGAIISEYPPDTKVKKSNFPARNRIVSALTLGTLVIESAYRSGTSITAGFTMKQGKEVFCVPNSIGNKNSNGIINLLMKGSKIVKDANNIIENLPVLKNKIKPVNFEEVIGNLSDQGKQTLNEFKEKVKLLNLKDSCIKPKKITVKLDNGTKNNVQPEKQIGKTIEQIIENKGLTKQQIEIVKLIFKNKIISINEISNILRISIQNVNCDVTILEIQGIIIQKGGNQVQIK